MDLHTSTGGPIDLGDQIGRGGQGSVYRIRGERSLLAKVYHAAIGPDLRDKFQLLVSKRTAELEQHAAWPRDLLWDRSGACRGLVVPAVEAPSVIDRLAHPGEQRQTWPDIDYGFLVHVSLNVMRAAEAIHRAGCVIGDVNDGNVMVLRDGTIRYIDVDSFQCDAGRKRFRSTVGHPLYTPPELQNRDFARVDRTIQHDSFGLAVLIFQLLMQGCHPFAGVPRDGRVRSPEDAIADGVYPHSSSRSRKADPPPGRMPIYCLGPLAALFEQAFEASVRPIPSDWCKAIDSYRRSLKSCKSNKRHGYLSNLRHCPLCSLAVDPFPSADQRISVSGLRLDELLAKARAAPVPRPMKEIAVGRERPLDPIELEPPALPDRLLRMDNPNRPKPTAKIAAGVLLGLGLLFGASSLEGNSQMTPAAVLAIVAGALMSTVVWSQHSDNRRLIETRKAEAISQIGDDFSSLQAEMRTLLEQRSDKASQIETLVQSSNRDLPQRYASLVQARRVVEEGKQRIGRAKLDAAREYREHLLLQSLRRFAIRRANIPGIGDSRRATLESFGIHTAADIDLRMVIQIPGFGSELTGRLMQWRRDLEAKHAPPLGVPVPPEWSRARTAQAESVLSREADKLASALAAYTQSWEASHSRLRSLVAQQDAHIRDYRAAVELFRAL